MLNKIFRYWVPVGIMLGLMYYFSTDVFSGENTRSMIEVVLGWIMPEAKRGTVIRFNYYIRKAGHFTEYAVLAALLFRAFRADSTFKWRVTWAAYSFAIILAWALVDEYHQTFTSRRGGSIYDSLLDVTGGLFGLIVVALLSLRKNRAD